ncbi:hypothetical protein ACFL17_09535 [Pseudomonadota bacterium]
MAKLSKSVGFIHKTLALGQVLVVAICSISSHHAIAQSTPAVQPSNSNDGNAQFKINKIELKINEETKSYNAAQNEIVHAVAEVHFQQSGLLQAKWEIASPSSSKVRRFSDIGSISEILTTLNMSRIVSPTLTTSFRGNYVIRFTILEPKITPNSVTLGYSVGKAP